MSPLLKLTNLATSSQVIKCLVRSFPAPTLHNLSSLLVEIILNSFPLERILQGACVCIALCAACQKQESDQVSLSICPFVCFCFQQLWRPMKLHDELGCLQQVTADENEAGLAGK